MPLRSRSVRRTTDRIEDLAAWLLIAAGLLVVLLSCGFGAQIHNQAVERGRVESAQDTPAVARLLADTAVSVSPSSSSSTVMAPATWQDRSGLSHTGLVLALRGLRAGDTVAIWTDASGAVAPAPTSEQDALLTALIAGGVAFSVGIGLLLSVWAVLRRAVMAANCARWEQEWREVAPTWTRGEGTRG